MTGKSGYSRQEDTLAWLEDEQKRAGKLRNISYTAWIVTFVVIALYAVMVGIQAVTLVGQGGQEVFSLMGLTMLVKMIAPLLVVVGVTALLIAVLSTVGVFVRVRTASLAEIQLRLAALENALTHQED
jgi:peptidoglycan biosynthesis protein MviN/MurJ (putative lipid II flippase)